MENSHAVDLKVHDETVSSADWTRLEGLMKVVVVSCCLKDEEKLC